MEADEKRGGTFQDTESDIRVIEQVAIHLNLRPDHHSF
jgi:hypothetical protein